MNYTTSLQQTTAGIGAIEQRVAPDTISHLTELIRQQSQELRERSSSIALGLCGSIPQAAGTERKDTPPSSVLDVLRNISGTLSEALSEVERIQRQL